MTPATMTTPLLGRGWHGGPVRRLVVHSMAEYVVNKDAKAGPVGRVAAHVWLGATGLSAHALIRPDGTVCECVPLNQRAYHARGFNDRTVGVELLVAGDHDYGSFAQALGWDLDGWAAVPEIDRPPQPYAPEQYSSLAWWLERAAAELGLGWDAVTSHDRLDPTRKFDPGPLLDWQLLATTFNRLRLEREAGPLSNPEE